MAGPTARGRPAPSYVIMSNALQGGASPAAGGVIGTGGELGMQPATNEEELSEGEEEEEEEGAEENSGA